jgi:isopentenyl-diphosphate Delta-isomerase
MLPERKNDHIRINLEEDVSSSLSSGFNKYFFQHQALPEIDLNQVDSHLDLFGKTLNLPLLISSMTGGTPDARKINENLARAAQAARVAMGVGSQRAVLELPEVQNSYNIRKTAPDVLIFANLGAIQLNYGYTIEHCRRAVELINADALILHLNPLQEALQPEGETRFFGLINKIEFVVRHIGIPVIIKEVGWGISERVAKMLAEVGVTAIDVAGAGGTSWSQVEMYRMEDLISREIAANFRDWGITTVESIQIVRKATPDMMIFASGGIKNGVDIAKSLALGATLGGMAGPFLKTANHSEEATMRLIDRIAREIHISMFAAGAQNLEQLRNTPLFCSTGR